MQGIESDQVALDVFAWADLFGKPLHTFPDHA
jgi:hypothetical protein